MTEKLSALPIFLTTKEVAGILKTSSKTIQSLIKAKQGPPVHLIGKRLRFRKDDVLHWLDNTRR